MRPQIHKASPTGTLLHENDTWLCFLHVNSARRMKRLNSGTGYVARNTRIESHLTRTDSIDLPEIKVSRMDTSQEIL